jgi:hypothetical protein
MLNVIQKKKQFKSVTPEKRNFAQLSQGVTGAKTDENRTVVGRFPYFTHFAPLKHWDYGIST